MHIMDIEESPTCSMETKMHPKDCAMFNKLRLKGKIGDVVIKASGVEFSAHKSILCRCSPYFRALFKSSWHNGVKKMYDIPGVSPEIMKFILEYAYTETVKINTKNVENLFIAADYLNILGLVRLCSEFLGRQLCPQNCIGILKFTENYYCPELHQEAFMYILHNYKNIRKTSDELLALSPMELRDLLERVEQGKSAFEATT